MLDTAVNVPDTILTSLDERIACRDWKWRILTLGILVCPLREIHSYVRTEQASIRHRICWIRRARLYRMLTRTRWRRWGSRRCTGSRLRWIMIYDWRIVKFATVCLITIRLINIDKLVCHITIYNRAAICIALQTRRASRRCATSSWRGLFQEYQTNH